MRAANMQVLTDQLKARYPGVVIYGIGDAAHKLQYSDHNEDDTPGSLAEQSDADDIPEHRAIDQMLSGQFTKDEADAIVARALADKEALARLHYIIWNHHIWRANGGWAQEDYVGDNPHTDHVHWSGLASDDENTASWGFVMSVGDPSPAPAPAPAPVHLVKLGDKGVEVAHIQSFFRFVFPAYRYTVRYRIGVLISVDGDFGPQTEAWVKEFQRRTQLVDDGVVGPRTFAMLRKYGYTY